MLVSEPDRPFFYDVAELPGHTIVDLVGDDEASAPIIDLFGRDLVTRTILQSPNLCVYHETANPGERVNIPASNVPKFSAGSQLKAAVK